MQLWTVGYGRWPASVRAARLLQALTAHGITRLVDTRHSPCASDPTPGARYGAKAWNLQAGDAGIVGLLATSGIAYEWIVELGNPQRHDRSMTVLRSHLADPSGDWPVHRGLLRLASRLREPGARVALLCSCAEAARCHRTVVAHALNDRHFGGGLTVREITGA